MNELKVSSLEAYKAMYKFLEREYSLTNSDDIGGLLGSMSLLEDGGSADPDMKASWDEILLDVAQNGANINLTIK